MFLEFHQLDPKKVGQFGRLEIPEEAVLVGEAKYIAYRSNKWSGKGENYIHDHEGGVKTYRPDSRAGRVVDVPEAVRSVQTLVRLGHCLGFGYTNEEGQLVEAKIKTPTPELYCAPNGSVLFVIQNKSSIKAMMWGGNLDVTWRGIVG